MFRPLALYVLAAILVVGYANTFEIWRWLVANFGGSAAYVPFAAAGAGAAALIVASLRRRARLGAPNWGWLLLSLSLAAAALAMTDPQFPAKRIHLPQYYLMALLMRAALVDTQSENLRTAGAALLASLFGIHDEILQGLIPARTYGLADIAVNAVSALAGAVGGRALAGPAPKADLARPSPDDLAVLAAQAAIAGPVLVHLVALRGAVVDPLWALPFAAAGALSLASRNWRRVLVPAGWICAALGLPIMFGHVFGLVFS